MFSFKEIQRFFWLLLLLSPLPAMAQEPFYIHYDEDNGLPSNEVYGIFQDPHNTIWANTDRGIVCFNGYEFKTYTISDGLSDNCILRMGYDKINNRIWATSLVNTIDFIKDGRISTPKFSKLLQANSPHEKYVQSVFADSDSSLQISFNYLHSFRVLGDSTLDRQLDNNEFSDASVCVSKNENGYFWHQISWPEPGKPKPVTIKQDGNKLYLYISHENTNDQYRKDLAQISENEFLFSYHNRLLHIRDAEVIADILFDEEIHDVFVDKNNNFWVSVNKLGAYCYTDGTITSEPVVYLKNKSVTQVHQDHQGSYWFAVKDFGIYIANNLDVLVFNAADNRQEDNIITALCSTPFGLYAGNNSGQLFKLIQDNGKHQFKEIQIPASPGVIRGIFRTQYNSLILLTDYIVEITPDGSPTGLFVTRGYAYDFLIKPNGNWLISYSTAIHEYASRKKIKAYLVESPFMRIKKMLLDHNGTIWLSSQTYGVYNWKPDKNIPDAAEQFGKLQKVRSSAFVQIDSVLFSAVSGRGIYTLYPDGSIDSIKMRTNGLSSDIVDNLFVESDSVIWAGTNRGLNRIKIQSLRPLKVDIESVSRKTGLSADRIYAVTIFDESIWIATNNGLVHMQSDNINQNNPQVDVRLTGVSLNGVSETDLSTPLDIIPRVHTLSFSFEGVSFIQPHEVYYTYQLENVDADPIMTKDRSVRYPDLGHGKYIFKVGASLDEHLAPKSFVYFDFKIKKAFDQTIFFIALIVLIGLALVYWIVILIVRDLKRREDDKRRLLEAEKRSLLAQMNPHFIFNSLNSIQHYMIQNDEENANLYLSRFSSLIRRILDNSKKPFISLASELDTISLYLNLEKLRFEDDFDFQISKDPNLDQNVIQINPMLIQPFVENAVWHGIGPKNDKGFIEISLQKFDDRMKIIIRDDGVGRGFSAKMKKQPAHTKTGIQNVTERIDLINKMQKQRIYFDIHDLTDKENRPQGTQVEINMPITRG